MSLDCLPVCAGSPPSPSTSQQQILSYLWAWLVGQPECFSFFPFICLEECSDSSQFWVSAPRQQASGCRNVFQVLFEVLVFSLELLDASFEVGDLWFFRSVKRRPTIHHHCRVQKEVWVVRKMVEDWRSNWFIVRFILRRELIVRIPDAVQFAMSMIILPPPQRCKCMKTLTGPHY